ncbi:hypothetical protein [Tropicimonas sp. IMCC34011]|uniref:hypothetical protein n=1 Tax=Tropicimonas sp. IMCC34011 TaxID=2248759 RepID=UPI000E2569FF|nr:hypothetical protein [Tropicimonas sp. IMCC34011]
MESEILARTSASRPRALFGTATLGVLAALCFWLALSEPALSLVGRLFVIALAAGALAGAVALFRAGRAELILTREALTDGEGREIFRVSKVVGVDRGVLAVKPSNGFLVRLSEPGGMHWSPGLWWRVGRRVGVGGLTAPSRTKAMAEGLSLLVAERTAQ